MFANDLHQFIVVLNELTVRLYTLLNRIQAGIEMVIEGYADPHLFPALADKHIPLNWIFPQIAIISLEKPLPGMLRDMFEKIWPLPWFAAAWILAFVAAASRLPLADWKNINLLALDATGCRSSGNLAKIDRYIVNRVDRRCREYGLA